MSSASIDVVIVAYRSRTVLDSCLASVRSLPELGNVVVVDHGDDGSGDVAEACGAVVVRDTSNPGFAAGQNRGVAATTAPFLLLLNPDAQVVADGIGTGLEALRRSDDVAVVQGQILNRADRTVERSQGVELGPLHLLGRALGAKRLLTVNLARRVTQLVPRLADHVDRTPEEARSVEAMAATAWLVRRSAFEQVGGFSERYFLYGEDLDLCRRLRLAGWRLLATPDRWAVHEGGGSAEGWWPRELEWWRGTMCFAATWWSTPSFAIGVGAAVARWTVLAAHRPRSAAGAWHGLVTEALRVRRTAHP